MDHSPNNDKTQEISSNIQNNDNDNKGAIYITVGPQCSGKTTILKELLGSNETNNQDSIVSSGRDITIDDQALVYLKLPTPIYLISDDKSPEMKATCDALYDQVVLGRSIIHRLSDACMDELSWVMQRLRGDIDADFFAKRIRNEDEKKEEDEDDNNMSKSNKAQSSQTNQRRTTQDDLIDAVEYVIRTKTAEGITNLLPETVDLFIVESIFRPRPLSEISQFAGDDYHRLRDLSKRNNRHNAIDALSALEDAQTTLQSLASDSTQYPPTVPLSWGNTNTRPREMITALEAAEKSHRPVQFIIYGGLEACDEIRNHTFQVDNDLTLCLTKSSRLTLLKRNICRFVETGRYIPCSAVADALERVNSMVATAVAGANKKAENSLSSCDNERANDAKFRLDYELAKLAGYQLHANRTVSCLSSSNNNNNNRGNYSSGGRGNNAGGRGRYNGGRNNYNRGRGQNNSNGQDYQRRRDQYNSRGGGRGGGRSYTQSSDGRGYNQGRGGDSYRNQNGGRGSHSYNNNQGRGGSSHHQGGRYHSNQERYRGRNPNQYSEDSRMSDGLEPRGNSTQYRRSGSNQYNGRGRGRH